jgi:AcrR family transcriptional regulator
MSSDTRENILEATLELMVRQGNVTASMGKIAKEAGVSRQAVYLHFDSRADLLMQFTEWTDATLGIPDRIQKVVAIEDPREQLFAMVGLSIALEPELAELTAVLDHARATDEDLAAAWNGRIAQRRSGHNMVWARAAEAGLLADGWTPERAADVTVALTLPASYRSFVTEGGWSHEEWGTWVMSIVESMLAP